MDAKALAKSKRAHSQHLSKKHHPNVTSKVPSVGASSGKITSGKQVREKPHQSQGSSKLPSNWDRYEEEYDPGSEDPSHSNTSQATDVFMPKSKGADYGHLISEAKSQPTMDISSEEFPSFDDVLSDFDQGVGSLLSVRGQGILSWTGDDNFVVEDRATGSHEASFLSLNLHRLAEQLARVGLPQRLFIDPEFLPPELFTEEFKTSSSEEPGELQPEFQSEGVKKNSDELATDSYHRRDRTEDQVSDFMPPDSYGLRHSVSASSNQGLNSMDQFVDELNNSGHTSEIPTQYTRPPLDGTSGRNPTKISSTIQAAVAEAEFDTLLDSFSDTHFTDSSAVTKKSSDSFSVQQQETSSRFEGTPLVKQVPNQLSWNVPDLSKPASVANFDDALDDLLNETSSSGKVSVAQQETSTSVSGGDQSVQSAGSQLSRKGPDLPKSATVTESFDDALDDLLNETSNLTNHKVSRQPHEVITTHLDIKASSSSGPVSKSKVLDDFDSWFDNIDGP